MKIGERWRSGQPRDDDAPRGPWSDLPPPAPPPPHEPRLQRRRPFREPIVNNWRWLLVILFLLFVAPWVARVASAVILGLLPGR